ncbi:hypothetical protein SAMN05518683_104153 [Salibacterium halotolerans]|uniref:Uncharacterized protein n=1 Tax=Salibacterium halotolerans TaxID=1884432 RepID=A0A1I5PJR5_9BACI|nr:hypothetical protein SAMN05518683_104153 [Salibacterium halotolerans]
MVQVWVVGFCGIFRIVISIVLTITVVVWMRRGADTNHSLKSTSSPLLSVEMHDSLFQPSLFVVHVRPLLYKNGSCGVCLVYHSDAAKHLLYE